jgi:hypothetical protein
MLAFRTANPDSGVLDQVGIQSKSCLALLTLDDHFPLALVGGAGLVAIVAIKEN